MFHTSSFLAVLTFLVSVVYCIPRYTTCQAPKPASFPATFGCPEGTIFVALNDTRADFTSIQAAVDSLPDDTTNQTVLIGAGTYHETVNISRHGPTVILGETANPLNYSFNLVTIWNSSAVDQSLANSPDDATTAVLTIAPSGPAALIGSGYYGYNGTPPPTDPVMTDTKIYNLNLENLYANYSDGPALALDVSFAHASFYGVSFKSYQDTLYVGHNASAFFKNVKVLGQTDYIFGFGTAWFQDSLIGSRGAGGGVTAWKGTPNFTNTYGVYFDGCEILAAPDKNSTLDLTGLIALGRPWNNASRSIYMRSYMDSTIQPGGFIEWASDDPRTTSPPLEYGEYENYGPGYNASARVSFDHILNITTVQPYVFTSVFDGYPRWIDYLY